MQVRHVGVAAAERQHASLDHRALDVIVLQHHVLLERLDGVELVLAAQLSQHHLHTQPTPLNSGLFMQQFHLRTENIINSEANLAEAAFAEHFEEVEVAG